MLMPRSPAESMLFATLRLEVLRNDGSTNLGTGFLFEYRPKRAQNDQTLPLLVTNRHLIQDSSTGHFTWHLAEEKQNLVVPSGKFFTVKIEALSKKFICHPDPRIDLCAMPYNLIRQAARAQGVDLFEAVFTEDLVLDSKELNELDAVEDVLLIGYPIGLQDPLHNLPIVRRGITATHPGLDFDGQPIFLVDAACFPGSSGSPVVLANLGWYRDKHSGSLVVGNRLALLGVLFAGIQWEASGKLERVPIPTNVEIQIKTGVMAHLGLVVKAQEILRLASYIEDLVQTGQYKL